MPRYIDADALYDLIDGGYDIDFDEVPETKAALLHMIDEQPTADVVERKVGKWMKHNDRACWYCSECKEDNYYAYSWNSDTGKYEFQDHYCSNCGAEMRGEDE